MAPSNLPAPLIRSRLESGKVIPFLGSGASLGHRDPRLRPWHSLDPEALPSATELAEHLATLISFPSEETRELTKVSTYHEVMAGRDVLDEELHEVFQCQTPYGKIHEYLAQNPVPLLIISTNYDWLMERALSDAGREFDVIVHLTPATLKRATDNERADSLLWRPHGKAARFVTGDELDLDLAHNFIIYKMHGSVDLEQSKRDSYVITEDDYVDFLTRMMTQEASAIPSFVVEYLATRTVLFLGYSLRDWNLRVLLNQMDHRTRRAIISWAVQYKPSDLEKQFWGKRDVTIFDLAVDEFVNALRKA